MKVRLMYPDHDFVSEKESIPFEEILTQDLELGIIFETMAAGDKFISKIVKQAVFNSLDNKNGILYRQEVLKDCIKNSSIIRTLYDIASKAIEMERHSWWRIPGIDISLSSTLTSAVGLLQMFMQALEQLHSIANQIAYKFDSKAFTAFFKTIELELNDEYRSDVKRLLNELKFKDGLVISTELGEYNQGIHYILCKQNNKKIHRWKWYFAPSMDINPRDQSGCNDLSRRKDRAINLITNALAQSTDHVLSFFTTLQTELAFYVGCLNLYDKLSSKARSINFPNPFDIGECKYSVAGLYDASLALILDTDVIGNYIEADNKDLFIITGANQGGKSTFLRSVGQAQLMMQCGMFVTAESFKASICRGIFTHFRKEEDTTMESGKLDEELSRMDDIVEIIMPDSMILFNESFSATNEREGSEIGRQIVHALLENHIKVFFVSHLYDFSNGFFEEGMENALFLRAERDRTFRLIPGKPLPISFGEDLYGKIFKADEPD